MIGQTNLPMDIIDAHAAVGDENHLRQDVTGLLAQMDLAGISLAVARPLGRDLVWSWRAGNADRFAKASSRVRWWATVNPWAGAEAVDEVSRSVERGATGLFLHPARQGFMPIEPIASPVLEAASRFSLPVMIQTGTYIYGDVLAVAEVARRYPNLPIILGGGGFTDMWFEVPGVMAEQGNLYLDASMLWGDAIQEVVDAGYGERIIFGSGSPRNHSQSVLRLLSRLELSTETRAAILGYNAKRVLKL